MTLRLRSTVLLSANVRLSSLIQVYNKFTGFDTFLCLTPTRLFDYYYCSTRSARLSFRLAECAMFRSLLRSSPHRFPQSRLSRQSSNIHIEYASIHVTRRVEILNMGHGLSRGCGPAYQVGRRAFHSTPSNNAGPLLPAILGFLKVMFFVQSMRVARSKCGPHPDFGSPRLCGDGRSDHPHVRPCNTTQEHEVQEGDPMGRENWTPRPRKEEDRQYAKNTLSQYPIPRPLNRPRPPLLADDHG